MLCVVEMAVMRREWSVQSPSLSLATATPAAQAGPSNYLRDAAVQPVRAVVGAAETSDRNVCFSQKLHLVATNIAELINWLRCTTIFLVSTRRGLVA